MTGPVAVLASRVGPEEKSLLAELRRRSVPGRPVDPRSLWVQAGPDRPAGLDGCALALNREIGYHRALHAARSLEACGITVVNSAAATEACGDKWRTTLALRAAGLPTPRTALALTPGAALDALDALGYPAVLKPLVGSWGRLVTLIEDRCAGAAVLEHVAALPGPESHIVYVQEYVAHPGRDIRVLVAGPEPVAAMYRYAAPGGWRTNVARGGRGEHCELSPDLARLAAAAARAVGASVAGVDLIETADGRLSVLEVNGRAEFAGLQAAAGERVNIAARIIDVVVDGAP
jgi:[lysine-biosynthesis-protein LysW]--L-2-aminoadipate ligase